MKATVNLDGLHKLSSFHRKAVLKASRIGCFCCLRFHKPKDIHEWIDHREKRGAYTVTRNGKVRLKGQIIAQSPIKEGQTAVCPHCGVDAVLPDRTYGFRLSKALLVAMCEAWFTGTGKS